MKLSNKKIKYIKRQASKKTPEEIAKDLRISLKDVQKVLKQLKGESQKSSISTKTAVKSGDTAYKYHLIAVLAICLLGIIVYSNTLNSPFIFDDSTVIIDNPIVKNLGFMITPSTAKVHKSPFEYELFRRRYVGFLTFALNYRMHGLNVAGYHVVNLYIHIINALLVYWLVVLTFRTPFLSSTALSDQRQLFFPFNDN